MTALTLPLSPAVTELQHQGHSPRGLAGQAGWGQPGAAGRTAALPVCAPGQAEQVPARPGRIRGAPGTGAGVSQEGLADTSGY